MLDDRKAAILQAVVNEYITTAQPVGSVHVARNPAVDVSPATVRSDMSTLETEGYLVQPHTSAGRIPTDKGYRYFVDNLAGTGALAPGERREVHDFFHSAHSALERLLQDTSHLLAGLTHATGLVVGRMPAACEVRAAQLVPLDGRGGLLVLVLSTGDVERIDVDLPAGDGEAGDAETIRHANAALNRLLAGCPLGSVQEAGSIGDQRVDGVVRACLDALQRASSPKGRASGTLDHVYFDGVAHMAEAFDAIETVRSLAAVLEQQYLVLTLVRDVIDRGLSVSIGTEHGVVPLEDCSIVVAPYTVGGETVGSIGVLGPTRMDYTKALATVAVVGRGLGDHLSEAI